MTNPPPPAGLSSDEHQQSAQVYSSLSQRVEAGELTLTISAGEARLLLAERAERQQAWQPIATMPDDAGQCLVYWSRGDAGIDIVSGAQEYRDILALGEPPATHWMPLALPACGEGDAMSLWQRVRAWWEAFWRCEFCACEPCCCAEIDEVCREARAEMENRDAS